MGKSSGGIRNAGKNPRKSKVDENDIKVGTGVFGENENWRITSKKSDLIGIFPKKNYSKDEAIKSFLDNINRSENKNLQKVSSENLLKSSQKQSNSTQVNALVKQNFQHYLNNRKERGAQLLKQLQDGIKALKSRNSSGNLDKAGQINLKASEILIKKVTRDFDSYSKRMKSYKEFAKKEKAIKRSTKGLPTGLRKAIVNQYLNGET